ncbi:MAG: TraR/DksA family transcriptional regulator [Chloroflexi bacterium]|nr:TraR/DksA family transcriptional regulator [Chloroflexota bacterium]
MNTTDVLTPGDLRVLRTGLEDRQRAVIESMAQGWRELHDLTKSQAQEDGLGSHPADVGTEMEQQQEVAARLQMLDADLQEVKDALDRMDNNTYGVCTDCLGPISIGRLRTLPTASRDIDCQRRYEARQKSRAA